MTEEPSLHEHIYDNIILINMQVYANDSIYTTW